MEESGAILLLWLLHAGLASAVSAPIVFFGRRRVDWRPWEALVLVLPFMIWTALMFSPLAAGRKSLANLGEPFYFAVAIPLAALVRVGIGSRLPDPACAAGLIGAVCILAGAVFFLVPPLPE